MAKTALKSDKPTLAELKQRAKQLIRSSEKHSLDMDQIAVKNMATAYEQALCIYAKNGYIQVFDSFIDKDNPSWNMLLIAVKNANELGVTFDTYVKGMFYSIDASGRSPRPHMLGLEWTKGKVEGYLRKVEAGEISPDSYQVSPVVKVKKTEPVAEVSKSDTQLKTLMNNFNMTEEEVLKKYATRNVARMFFDKDWLLQNETYLRLKKSGELI